MSFLSSVFGASASGSGQNIVGAVTQAREALASKFGAQTTLGRAMRSFNSAGNPIAGAINMIGSIFGGSKYRSDQYRAGEKYMLYILGIDIHSYKKVEDAMVPEALQFWSLLLGINIESWTGIEELKDDIALFKRNRKPGESDEKIQDAQKILKSLPWNDVAGAWVSPISQMFPSAVNSGNIVDDVQNVAAGMGIGKNSLLIILVGCVLLFLLLFRRK